MEDPTRNIHPVCGPVLAMTARISAGALSRSIAPDPSQGEVWKRLVDAWPRIRFTARVVALVKLRLRWMR